MPAALGLFFIAPGPQMRTTEEMYKDQAHYQYEEEEKNFSNNELLVNSIFQWRLATHLWVSAQKAADLGRGAGVPSCSQHYSSTIHVSFSI